MKLIKSIYWEQGDREELIYRFPFNNISLGSVLTVNESQEALFFKNGVLCDVFGAGRHVLSAATLPVLNRFVNLTNKVDETFTAEVWFVSKLDERNTFWSTGWLPVLEPLFNNAIPIKISAQGQYGVRIVDSALFLKKLIGTLSYVTTELIEKQFRIDVVETVKVTVSKFLKENNMSTIQLGAAYVELSKSIAKELQAVYEAYGVELLNFNIESISLDEEDPNYKEMMEIIRERERLRMLGTTYIQDRQLEIAQDAAKNEGNSVMNVLMGLTMGSAMGKMVGDVMQPQTPQVVPSLPSPALQIPQPLPYYVAKNGEPTGPFTIDIIQRMILQGEVIPATQIWKAGVTDWYSASSDVELSRLFAQMIPPPPPVV